MNWFFKVDYHLVNFSIRKFLSVALAFVSVAVFAACSSAEKPPTSEPIPTEHVSPQPTQATEEKPPLAAPVFAVTTADGETVKLKELVGTVPVYVLFVPSTVDELDREQLKIIQARYEVFVELNAKVVVVVADLPTNVIDMRDELGLEFALIADPLFVVAADWRVFDLDGEGKVSPASFVFDAFGNLIARLVAAVPDDRPTVDEVLFAIEASLSSAAA